MSIKDYAGGSFYTVADVADGPKIETIAGIVDGSFQKPNLIFESGNKLSLNKKNARILCKLFGEHNEDYVGEEIELFEGIVPYQGKDHPSVLIRAPKKAAGNGSGDPDDAVPF